MRVFDAQPLEVGLRHFRQRERLLVGLVARRLADVHRPMVRELFGGQGDWLGSEAQLDWLGSEAQLKASDPGWRESCAPG